MKRNNFLHAFLALQDYRNTYSPRDMRREFSSGGDRFSRFSLTFGDMLLDWSKCAVDEMVMRLLAELALAAELEQRRHAMFGGEKINGSEERAVLHIALRAPQGTKITVDGVDVMPDVHTVLNSMCAFAEAVRSGVIRTATGQKFTDVVNIGIGGSDLGSTMVAAALKPFCDGPRTHFVSNVDGAHIHDVLQDLDPRTTLVIVASKTFTTIETMTNAETARRWITKSLGDSAIRHHFVAVSTSIGEVVAFGVDEARIFGFWDWVGGRYSLWSAIGLPIMLTIGPQNFRSLLAGAHAMDEHFRTAPLLQNLPVVLGLIGFWHRVVCNYSARAVIPYDQRLARLPAFLQQLDMESNGKGVQVDGLPVITPTGPLVWGEPGTNGQHAFFQLLHQGTDIVPVEFIVAAESHEAKLRHHHELLLANCLAQSQALMTGRTLEEATEQLVAKGLSKSKANALAPHRVFPGNRPSLVIAYRQLDPFALGRLLALYEHRVFVEAQLFGINAFDQWGVELGKELATELLPVLQGKLDASGQDSSTAGVIGHLRKVSDAS